MVLRCCDTDEKVILVWMLFWISYSDFFLLNKQLYNINTMKDLKFSSLTFPEQPSECRGFGTIDLCQCSESWSARLLFLQGLLGTWLCVGSFEEKSWPLASPGL